VKIKGKTGIGVHVPASTLSARQKAQAHSASRKLAGPKWCVCVEGGVGLGDVGGMKKVKQTSADVSMRMLTSFTPHSSSSLYFYTSENSMKPKTKKDKE